MQHLEDQQQEVEEPPGRVRADDGPALKHGGVEDPGKDKDVQISISVGEDVSPAERPLDLSGLSGEWPGDLMSGAVNRGSFPDRGMDFSCGERAANASAIIHPR